ncbi:MAG: acyl-ACP--UDP-N-acetylglucosamine O-acyltransferase [Candidatus Glassbacteria bacterium]
MATIHPTAIIDEGGVLAEDVTVGPYSIIGPGVMIGRGTMIGSRVLIEKRTKIGSNCKVHTGAIVGTDPQDLKFQGEDTELIIGDRTVIREYATLNRGTQMTGRTQIGSDCFIMAYVHIAHDCYIGDHVILANAVNMAGHVMIEDHVTVGGITPIHQFVRIGKYAFIGGGSRVNKDVPPFVRAVGNPLILSGLNSVGLARHGVPEDIRVELKRAYRIFFRSDLDISKALQRAREELKPYPEIQSFIEFIEKSKRGITI